MICFYVLEQLVIGHIEANVLLHENAVSYVLKY